MILSSLKLLEGATVNILDLEKISFKTIGGLGTFLCSPAFKTARCIYKKDFSVRGMPPVQEEHLSRKLLGGSVSLLAQWAPSIKDWDNLDSMLYSLSPSQPGRQTDASSTYSAAWICLYDSPYAHWLRLAKECGLNYGINGVANEIGGSISREIKKLLVFLSDTGEHNSSAIKDAIFKNWTAFTLCSSLLKPA
jgi:hypothetical protein